MFLQEGKGGGLKGFLLSYKLKSSTIGSIHNLFIAYLPIRFLRLLVDKLQLPAYGLVDSDPYGIDILATYRFGSMVRSFY